MNRRGILKSLIVVPFGMNRTMELASTVEATSKALVYGTNVRCPECGLVLYNLERPDGATVHCECRNRDCARFERQVTYEAPTVTLTEINSLQ